MRSWLLELKFWPSALLAATSSLLIAWGAPPGGWLPGQWLPGEWLGFVPLLVLARRPGLSGRRVFMLGLVGGLGIGLAGFPWIAELLVRFAGVPPPVGYLGLALFSLWMAIPYGIWTLGLYLAPHRGARVYLWPALLFVSLQFLWPNLFPYTPLLGFAERPALMQLAEWGGVPLLEAIVVIWATSAARLLMRFRGRAALGHWLVLLLLPPLLLCYGNWRMGVLDGEAEGAPTLLVGIVQPNVPIGGGSLPLRLARLREPSRELERRGAQLIVWPEGGSYPYPVLRPFRHERSLGVGRVMEYHRVPTLFGASSRARGERFGYNSAYLLAGDGSVVGRYDKVNLVPFGEFVPLIDPHWLTDRIPQIAHHEAGVGPTRFLLQGEGTSGPVALGPLICFEDILPHFVREVAIQEGGIDLLVNLTIDAWYGDSAEPREHLALAQFRSVENRLPMVRSTSTGVSAVVDYNGRLRAEIPLRPVRADRIDRFPAEKLLEEIRLPRNSASAPTPYARLGWLFPYASSAIALSVALLWFFGRRTAPSESKPG